MIDNHHYNRMCLFALGTKYAHTTVGIIVGGRREPPPNRRSYSALRDYSLMLLLTYKLKSLRGVGGLVKNLGRQGNEYDQVSERTSSARAKEKEDTKT